MKKLVISNHWVSGSISLHSLLAPCPPPGTFPFFTQFPCLPRFVALHSYSAHGPDELDLQKGEGIRVLGKYPDGWLRGISLVTGRVGTFPNNYVIPILRCVPSILRQRRSGPLGPGPSVVSLLKDSVLLWCVGQEMA